MSRNRTAALAATETTDTLASHADNDNSEDNVDNLARDVVAILLSEGRELLAG